MDLINTISIRGKFMLDIVTVEPKDIYSRSSSQTPWDLSVNLYVDMFLDAYTDLCKDLHRCNFEVEHSTSIRSAGQVCPRGRHWLPRLLCWRVHSDSLA